MRKLPKTSDDLIVARGCCMSAACRMLLVLTLSMGPLATLTSVIKDIDIMLVIIERTEAPI